MTRFTCHVKMQMIYWKNSKLRTVYDRGSAKNGKKGFLAQIFVGKNLLLKQKSFCSTKILVNLL